VELLPNGFSGRGNNPPSRSAPVDHPPDLAPIRPTDRDVVGADADLVGRDPVDPIHRDDKRAGFPPRDSPCFGLRPGRALNHRNMKTRTHTCDVDVIARNGYATGRARGVHRSHDLR